MTEPLDGIIYQWKKGPTSMLCTRHQSVMTIDTLLFSIGFSLICFLPFLNTIYYTEYDWYRTPDSYLKHLSRPQKRPLDLAVVSDRPCQSPKCLVTPTCLCLASLYPGTTSPRNLSGGPGSRSAQVTVWCEGPVCDSNFTWWVNW